MTRGEGGGGGGGGLDVLKEIPKRKKDPFVGMAPSYFYKKKTLNLAF